MNRILTLLLAGTLMLAACDDQSGNHAESVPAGKVATQSYMGGAVADSMIMPAPASPPTAALGQAPSSMVLDRSRLAGRRIAETHALAIETTYDTLGARFQRDYAKCVAMGCEVTNSNLQAEQSGHITSRIAPENLGAFLDFLATGQGRILNHQVTADDQTMEYSDLSAQMENLLASRERMRALMNSPLTREVDDVLRIEQELTRLQTEIDSRTNCLRIIAKMTDLATLQIDYSVEYRPAEVKPYELKNTFKSALQAFLMGVDRMIQFIGAALPWIPVVFIGFWLSVRMLRLAFAKTGWRMKWRKNNAG